MQPTSPNESNAPQQAGQPTPADFVLVHGAWHGAWCWRSVADQLQAAGHRVWVPTLSGLSDRRHLMSPAIDLHTHVDDVASLVQWQDLPPIVLVGHSYGGMVVTGALEKLGHERVRSLVYLDAFVPGPGQSLMDLVGPEAAARIAGTLAANGGYVLPPPPAAFFGPTGELGAWLDSKVTPQPYKAMTDVLPATGARDRVTRKTYVRTRRFPSPAFDQHARQFSGQPGWTVLDLDEHHDLMITQPGLTTRILLEAAA